MTIKAAVFLLKNWISGGCIKFTLFFEDTAVSRRYEVHIELYSDSKDPALENRVEDVFDKNEIFYNKSEVWIESEKLYEILYTFEMEV